MAKLNDNITKIKMNISIDKELQDRMVAYCQKDERSMSSLVSLALKEYLANHEKEDV